MTDLAAIKAAARVDAFARRKAAHDPFAASAGHLSAFLAGCKLFSLVTNWELTTAWVAEIRIPTALP